MRKMMFPMAFTVFLGACGYVDKYEEAVTGMEPTYCYKSLAGVECYREPYHRDARRLVNYFGPHPSRYDKPEKPEPAPHAPPPMVNYWVKDAVPVPRPSPTGKASNLPWLDPALIKAELAKAEFTRLSARRDGTDALLERMGIGPHGRIGPLPDARAGGTKAPVTAAAQAAGVPKATTEARAEVVPVQPPPPAVPVPPVVEVEIN